jgi:hypothetical protein
LQSTAAVRALPANNAAASKSEWLTRQAENNCLSQTFEFVTSGRGIQKWPCVALSDYFWQELLAGDSGQIISFSDA